MSKKWTETKTTTFIRHSNCTQPNIIKYRQFERMINLFRDIERNIENENEKEQCSWNTMTRYLVVNIS